MLLGLQANLLHGFTSKGGRHTGQGSIICSYSALVAIRPEAGGR